MIAATPATSGSAITAERESAPHRGLDATVEMFRGSLHLDVSLSVGMGSVVALLGPNGAGKSSLLYALAGLEPLAGGSVVLAGETLEDASRRIRLAPEQRPIGVVFQDYLLFPHMSVLENVAFGLRSRGVHRHEARTRAQAWLERVGLGDRGGSRPSTLSGGQAQRVALARALAYEPRLLLLDEPLAALDASTRVEIRRELRRHLESFHGVRLLVTHDPLEAIALADELIVMEAGRITQRGSAEEIRDRPRSRYIAQLVGVNLFRGRADADGVSLEGGAHLQAPDSGSGDVFAVVHPHAVSLHRHEPEGTPRNVWPGTIESLDLEGERVRVRIGGIVPIVAEVTTAAVSDLALADGGQVWASVKASEITVYPA